MGADIHMVLEQRHNDRWIGCHSFDSCAVRSSSEAKANDETLQKHKNSEIIKALIGSWLLNMPWPSPLARHRNYDLFGALAGVRGVGPEPKGLPDGLSDLAKLRLDEWGDDAHSITHYTMREATVIFLAYTDPSLIVESGLIYEGAQLFGANINEDSDADNYRLIIWFDN